MQLLTTIITKNVTKADYYVLPIAIILQKKLVQINNKIATQLVEQLVSTTFIKHKLDVSVLAVITLKILNLLKFDDNSCINAHTSIA